MGAHTVTVNGTTAGNCTVSVGAAGLNPEFDRPGGGTSRANDRAGAAIECPKPVPHLFDVYGGDTVGTYAVSVADPGGNSTRCGDGCVIGDGISPWLPFNISEAATPPAGTTNNRGLQCLPNRLLARLPAPDANGWIVDPSRTAVYVGTQPGPAEPRPPEMVGHASARRLAQRKFNCSTLEVWCLNGTQHYLLVDGCERTSWDLGDCLIANAANSLWVKYDVCGNAPEPVKTRFFNVQLGAGDRPSGYFELTEFDRCNATRFFSKYQGPAGVMPPADPDGGWGAPLSGPTSTPLAPPVGPGDGGP